MTNDQPRAPMKDIPIQKFNFEDNEEMFVLLSDHLELSRHLQKQLADNRAEIEELKQDLSDKKDAITLYKNTIDRRQLNYEELKARADKMYEALKLNQDYNNMKNDMAEFRKKHIISAGLHSSEYVQSQTDQAIGQYESIDKGNK